VSLSRKIARAGGAGRAMRARRGFVLHMFAGFVLACEEPNCRECPPKLYPTLDAANEYLAGFSERRRAVFDVHPATVIPEGEGGRPDYVLGSRL
jgi:hypothetical protein